MRTVDLSYAMRLPHLLNDWQRASEVEQVFQITKNDTAVEDETRQKIETLWYCPVAPDVSAIQVATHILRLQEETCYRWSKSDSNTYGSTTPEQVEFQNFRFFWGMGVHDVRPSPNLEDCEDIDGQLFSHGQLRCKATKDGRELRDAVSHRHVIEDWHIGRYAQSGIVLALLCDDRENALEIEIIAEQWLTKKSRAQVLARLQNYYCIIPDQNARERKRQIALNDIIEMKDEQREDRTKYTTMYLSLVKKDGLEGVSTHTPPVQENGRQKRRPARSIDISTTTARRVRPRSTALLSQNLSTAIPCTYP